MKIIPPNRIVRQGRTIRRREDWFRLQETAAGEEVA
jgi:hypothetical protein